MKIRDDGIIKIVRGREFERKMIHANVSTMYNKDIIQDDTSN
jgi:uncharacterized protein YqgQ